MHASIKHTLVTALPAASTDPSAICQQKSGLPPAQEDAHEYVCFQTSISLKVSRKAGTAVHAATRGTITRCSFGTTRVSTVSPAGTHTGQVDASVLVHWDVKKAEKEKKITYQIMALSRRRSYEQDLDQIWREKSTVPEVK